MLVVKKCQQTMDRNIFLFIFFFFSTFYSQAQDCTAFFVTEEGTTLKYETFNKKGKSEGTMEQKLISKEVKGDTTYFSIHQKISDKSGKNVVESDLVFKCASGLFLIDMNTLMLDDKQMEAFKNMEMSISGNDMSIPSKLEPGMKLDDAEINISLMAGAMNFQTRVFNRKVESFEDITTPAGTFKAYKISSDTESKMSFKTFGTKQVMWYAKDVGMIRSENYDRNNALESHMELVNISK